MTKQTQQTLTVAASQQVLALVADGLDPVDALRNVCGADAVDAMIDSVYNLSAAARYGNLCRVAAEFYVATGNTAEADYAYINARWAGRLALAELSKQESR